MFFHWIISCLALCRHEIGKSFSGKTVSNAMKMIVTLLLHFAIGNFVPVGGNVSIASMWELNDFIGGQFLRMQAERSCQFKLCLRSENVGSINHK